MHHFQDSLAFQNYVTLINLSILLCQVFYLFSITFYSTFSNIHCKSQCICHVLTSLPHFPVGCRVPCDNTRSSNGAGVRGSQLNTTPLLEQLVWTNEQLLLSGWSQPIRGLPTIQSIIFLCRPTDDVMLTHMKCDTTLGHLEPGHSTEHWCFGSSLALCS